MFTRRHFVAPVVVALMVLGAGGSARGDVTSDGLKPGDTLDKETWQKAEKLLPPEVLRHYKVGEYKNPFSSWPENV